MQRLFIACLMLLLLSSCAKQQALFLSEPAGARVSVNGEYVGTTPFTFDYKLSTRTENMVTIEKEGYVPLQVMVKADEVNQHEMKKWLTAGLVWSPLFMGALFTNGMNDSVMLMLKRDQSYVADATIVPTPSQF
jgi:hypothetical protein